MGKLAYLRPKKTYTDYDKKTSQTIKGSLDRVIMPAKREDYDNYCVFVICEKTIVGQLPFLDDYYVFNLICESKEHPVFGMQYKIIDFGIPAFEPVPLTLYMLKRMMVDEYGIRDIVALRRVEQLRKKLGLQTMSEVIDMETLVKFEDPGWLVQICQDMLVFKYPYLISLGKLWPVNILSRKTITELCAIVNTLLMNPVSFCCKWWNEHGMPEIAYSKLGVLEEVSNSKIEETIKQALQIYNHAKIWSQNRRRLSCDGNFSQPYTSESLREAIKLKLIVPKYTEIYESACLRQDKQFYIYHDLQMLDRMREGMAALFRCRKDPKEKQNPPSISKLTDQQLAAYNAVTMQNFLIILGDAGTGKTELGKYIYNRFRKKNVLVLAAYGRIASNLKAKYGKGMTIDMLLSHVKRKTAMGQILARDTRVIIIDEISLVSYSNIAQLLICVPEVRKLVLMGDEKQMPCIGKGGIIDALVRKYADTPVVHRLTKIMRLSDSGKKLKDTFTKIINGNSDLNYTMDLADDANPLVMIERVPARDNSPEAEVEATRDTLRQVLNYYNPEDLQILTQTNRYRHYINQAMFELSGFDVGFSSKKFHVGEKIMFSENFYYKGKDARYLRSDDVMNGEIQQIKHIFDVPPMLGEDEEEPEGVVVNSTDCPKPFPQWQRILIFESGKRLNMTHYNLSNITKGSASTIAAAEGSEYDIVVIYGHPNPSRTFNVREFYTAITRGKSRVILIFGRNNSGDLLHEVRNIINNPYQAPACTLHNWLPNAS